MFTDTGRAHLPSETFPREIFPGPRFLGCHLVANGPFGTSVARRGAVNSRKFKARIFEVRVSKSENHGLVATSKDLKGSKLQNLSHCFRNILQTDRNMTRCGASCSCAHSRVLLKKCNQVAKSNMWHSASVKPAASHPEGVCKVLQCLYEYEARVFCALELQGRNGTTRGLRVRTRTTRNRQSSSSRRGRHEGALRAPLPVDCQHPLVLRVEGDLVERAIGRRLSHGLGLRAPTPT